MFQLNLAIDLMQYAITLDWIDVNDETMKPRWMQWVNTILCNCNKCFCVNEITHGIAHHLKTRAPSSHTEVKCPTDRVKLTRCFQCCTVCNATHGWKNCPQTAHGCNICGMLECKQCCHVHKYDLQHKHTQIAP